MTNQTRGRGLFQPIVSLYMLILFFGLLELFGNCVSTSCLTSPPYIASTTTHHPLPHLTPLPQYTPQPLPCLTHPPIHPHPLPYITPSPNTLPNHSHASPPPPIHSPPTPISHPLPQYTPTLSHISPIPLLPWVVYRVPVSSGHPTQLRRRLIKVLSRGDGSACRYLYGNCSSREKRGEAKVIQASDELGLFIFLASITVNVSSTAGFTALH